MGIFSIFVGILVLFLLFKLYLSIATKKEPEQKRESETHNEALSILEKRFARGEIDEETFLKIKSYL